MIDDSISIGQLLSITTSLVTTAVIVIRLTKTVQSSGVLEGVRNEKLLVIEREIKEIKHTTLILSDKLNSVVDDHKENIVKLSSDISYLKGLLNNKHNKDN